MESLDLNRLAHAAAALSDEDLAALLESHARRVLERGGQVELDSFLEAIPDLSARPIALDAAIEFALRSHSASGLPEAAVVERFITRYPHLEEAIRVAASLAGALLSTTALHRAVNQRKPLDLPADFGPRLESGSHRYELRELLGVGAHGSVYLAIDRHMSESDHEAQVAVKVLDGVAIDDDTRERVLAEATKARRITNTHVVRVLDRGVDDRGLDYVVYDYVGGGDLGTALEDAGGRFDPRHAASLMEHVGHGVGAIHAAGLLHCDLKPSNVLMTTDGQPKVSDFGVAVRCDPDGVPIDPDTRHRVGNVAFMSPERYRMEPDALSVASDIYSLGAMLYMLLTGGYPNGNTVDEVRQTHHPVMGRTTPPEIPETIDGVDSTLRAICRRAMAPRPEDRYTSAEALALDLESWVRHEPVAWTAPTQWHRLKLFARRTPHTFALLVTSLVLLVTGAAGMTWLAGMAQNRAVRVRLTQAEADLAQARFDQSRQFQLDALHDFRSRVTDLVQNWLPFLTVLESMVGPLDLGSAKSGWVPWEDRIDGVAGEIHRAEMAGQGADFQTSLWRSARGYWLLQSGRFSEAHSALADASERWSTVVEPDDEWMAMHAALLAAACTGEEAEKTDTSRPSPDVVLGWVKTMEDALARPGIERSVPIRNRLYEALATAYEPSMLNDPQRLALYRSKYDQRPAERPPGSAAVPIE